MLVGLAMAMISIAGSYTRYVKPSLLPWLLAAAALLIGLALTAIVRDVRRGHAPVPDTVTGTLHWCCGCWWSRSWR